MSQLKIYREADKVIIGHDGDAIAIDPSKVSWAKDQQNPLSVYVIYYHPLQKREIQLRVNILDLIDEDNDPYASDYDDLSEELSKKLRG